MYCFKLKINLQVCLCDYSSLVINNRGIICSRLFLSILNRYSSYIASHRIHWITVSSYFYRFSNKIFWQNNLLSLSHHQILYNLSKIRVFWREIQTFWSKIHEFFGINYRVFRNSRSLEKCILMITWKSFSTLSI